ncbi:hypothetical protein DF3PA_250021 [Candidatus Defluviicoccus seviourii]|uniref:Uncharacterized protein n=2 Tax=root TaxID=1 RepID=A0A564WGC5_9PROT|nr:hypothetical protein DF3PB_280008 [uncultured Defluviicoccus sp.]VUX46613.1 hypothetical protein DF3PA_250021 [Candidatus Defluviicoccus seviourii]
MRGFNEAAALLPREGALEHERGGIDSDRFNEAAALLPREGLNRRGTTDHRGAASMRPRHYCRGRAWTAHHPRSRLNRFNEAAALLPREGPAGVRATVRRLVLQ